MKRVLGRASRRGSCVQRLLVRFHLAPDFGHGDGALLLLWNSRSTLDGWVEQEVSPSQLAVVDSLPDQKGRARPLLEFPGWSKYRARAIPVWLQASFEFRIEGGHLMKPILIALGFVIALSQASAAPIIQTKVSGGALQGVTQGSIAAYLGVPYAAPPVGQNRWRAPQPTTSWNGVRQATQFGANCYQTIMPGSAGFGPWTTEYLAHGPISEDCLFVNVWTPAQSSKERLQVLVWFHGGGFAQGSGSVPVYDGAALAAKGIVVVTVNYRLSTFGFMAHPELSAESPDHTSGNYGLLDAIAALKWVRDNIAAFGGDSNDVTISGQSAGAGIVVDLDVSPLSKGLYANAIAESGAGLGLPMLDLKQGEQSGVDFATGKGAQSLTALRGLPPDQLLPPMMQGPRFSPIVDGVVVPDNPRKLISEGRFNDTPFLTGLTADEGSGMNPKYGSMTPQECDQYVVKTGGTMADKFRSLYFNGASCNDNVKLLARDRGLVATYFWAVDRLKTAKQPVFVYIYDHPEPGPNAARYGAFHSSEIPYVFRTFDKSPERGFTETDQAISDKMSSYWMNFVRTGNPNGAGLPTWPMVDSVGQQVMELGNTFESRPVLPPDKLKLMEGYAKQGGSLGLF